MQRAISGKQRELTVFEPGEDGRAIVSRVIGKGLADELYDEGQPDRRWHGRQGALRRATPRAELEQYPRVEMKSTADVHTADRNIAALPAIPHQRLLRLRAMNPLPLVHLQHPRCPWQFSACCINQLNPSPIADICHGSADPDLRMVRVIRNQERAMRVCARHCFHGRRSVLETSGRHMATALPRRCRPQAAQPSS